MSLSLPLKKYADQYKRWVLTCPGSVTDFETVFKWSSYVIVGRVNNDFLSTELVYALSDLLVFLNDRIIQSSKSEESVPGDYLLKCLTILEYCEVFLELTAKRKLNDKAAWAVVVSLQVIKCTIRLILLLKYKRSLVSTPAVPPLKRLVTTPVEQPPEATSFTLKRSRRVIRKVEAAPPNGRRLWRPPSPPSSSLIINEDDKDPDTWELRRMILAELLYITRPISHLASIYKYGFTSWKPWLLSLAIDLSSISLLNTKKRSQLWEKEEISRRTLLLILYLMRSPFYERHSADRVSAFLDALARALPLARFIANPVKMYIPFWQSTYSYVWST